MLTSLRIKNFKRFEDVEIELGNPVVFIGPNNSGKTTALQALALWEIGLKKWVGIDPRGEVAINRLHLTAVPVPDADQLWRNLTTVRLDLEPSESIPLVIAVEGMGRDAPWSYGFDFFSTNSESISCRPAETEREHHSFRSVPKAALAIRTAFLTPSAGVVANESRIDPGAIDVRIGEGRTGEVLRNLCYLVHQSGGEAWRQLTTSMRSLFGVEFEEPQYSNGRGEVFQTYIENGTRFELSSAGRGLHQGLLLVSYLLSHPGTVLLLDEPDAHLEILLQRQIYQVLTDLARNNGCQIIATSHSAVILNGAADRDVVVAFVGRPHRIDDRGSQVVKALKEIGFEHFALAEQRGWVLYLEGSTDLAILQAFARTLDHPVASHLERPFVHYVSNQPNAARNHFFGLREAKDDLVGVAIYDRLEKGLPEAGTSPLQEIVWKRREIENYLADPSVLTAYATDAAHGSDSNRRLEVMTLAITESVPPFALRNPEDKWWLDSKVSDDFLDRVFERYFAELGLPNLLRKTDYHVLASLVPAELIAREVREKLDAILAVAEQAKPLE